MRKISASGLSLFRSCPKAYEYKYVKRYVRIDQQETEQLTIGKAFHSILEGEPIMPDLDEKTWLSIEASADYVKNSYKIKALKNKTLAQVDKNTMKEYELDDAGYIGYIDLVILDDKNGDTLVDYKYVSSLDYADAYRISDQTKLYPWLYTRQTGRKVNKFIYLCVVKPTIRQRKEETKQDYFERMREWYGNYDNKIGEIVIEKDELQELNLERNKDLEIFNYLRENELFWRNNGSCNKYNTQCAYYPICYKEEDWEIHFMEEVE